MTAQPREAPTYRHPDQYPVGDGCYDIAMREGHFVPSRREHRTPPHIARFGPSHTTHIHVRDGEEDDHYGEE